MKPLHALALACLLPFSILLVVGIAAATMVPAEGSDATATAAESAAAASAPAAPGSAALDGDLHQHMEALQSGMKEMRKMLGKDEQKADLAALAAKQQGHALACLTLLPKQETPIADPVEAAAWRIGYVRRMVEVYDTLLQLELAALKGEHEAVKALYKALGEQKTTGHEAFQAD